MTAAERAYFEALARERITGKFVSHVPYLHALNAERQANLMARYIEHIGRLVK